MQGAGWVLLACLLGAPLLIEERAQEGGCSQSLRSEVSSLGLDCGIICTENGPDTRPCASVQRGSFLEKDEICARP